MTEHFPVKVIWAGKIIKVDVIINNHKVLTVAEVLRVVTYDNGTPPIAEVRLIGFDDSCIYIPVSDCYESIIGHTAFFNIETKKWSGTL